MSSHRVSQAEYLAMVRGLEQSRQQLNDAVAQLEVCHRYAERERERER